MPLHVSGGFTTHSPVLMLLTCFDLAAAVSPGFCFCVFEEGSLSHYVFLNKLALVGIANIMSQQSSLFERVLVDGESSIAELGSDFFFSEARVWV